MKRILINSVQEGRLCVAYINGQNLYDLDIEYSKYKHRKLNIYKGKVIRIESSLNAAFIDYGANKCGFLPFKEISETYFLKEKTNKIYHNYNNILKLGQECIVQISKQERGKKGVSLTTFISLISSYLILMPINPGLKGISKKIQGKNRINLKRMFVTLNIPSKMGLIIRTSGLKKSTIDLQEDLNVLLKHWKNIQKIAEISSVPFLIYQEENIIFRTVRDYLCKDISEILVDNPITLNDMYNYLCILKRYDFKDKIKLYSGKNSLFEHYQIQSQIDSIFQRIVQLPSGGSITIDSLEALTAIDINSCKSIKGVNIEQTAFNTNLEAIYEIARQLRLRDLGGLIVIDFINMKTFNNKKSILHSLRHFLKKDRAIIKIGNISKFGLLEMSRQRLNFFRKKFNYFLCTMCNKKYEIQY
ncbi:MAG: Rne/Rng family ribonuclease [Buchnera aphidicola (Nurudea shiraii)]